MTDQIERCLCGGDVECLSGDTTLTSWMVCGWCDYESTTFETPSVAITTHNRMMLAARAPAVQGDVDIMEQYRQANQKAEAAELQATLAHQALLDERKRWDDGQALYLQSIEDISAECERLKGVIEEQDRDRTKASQSCAELVDQWEKRAENAAKLIDTVIAAHKQQIADLTDALAPVEWPPGRVPTEPGWYAYQERRPGTDGYFAVDLIHVIDGDDGLVAEYPGGGEGTINHMARWLGPVVLPRKRGGK